MRTFEQRALRASAVALLVLGLVRPTGASSGESTPLDGQNRITSYNVCYTKLLRQLVFKNDERIKKIINQKPSTVDGYQRLRVMPNFDFKHPDVIKYVLLTLPLMLGLTMTFSTEILMKFFGSFLSAGSIV